MVENAKQVCVSMDRVKKYIEETSRQYMSKSERCRENDIHLAGNSACEPAQKASGGYR